MQEPAARALRHVLVVEDDAAIRELIAVVARREGLDVREAANGVEGLVQLTQPPLPAAIILDLEMPLMHGLDFLRELRKVPGATDVPVILVSGHAGVSGLEALAVAAILPKPISVAQLASTLRSLVEVSGAGGET
jgi:two-component system chemotaxis response regulator CheY